VERSQYRGDRVGLIKRKFRFKLCLFHDQHTHALMMKQLAHSSLQVEFLFFSPLNSRSMVWPTFHLERFLSDVVPHARFAYPVYGFRPFLKHSLGIQSICQSGVRIAEIVFAETESSQMMFFGGQAIYYHRRSRIRSHL
jgi:hypothetical protein